MKSANERKITTKGISVFSLIITGSLFLSSCIPGDDYEPEEGTSPTKAELIAGKRSKTYKMTSFKVEEVEAINEYFPDECEQDNLFIFKSDKTYQFTEGATKCYPEDEDLIAEGHWSLSDDEKFLVREGQQWEIKTVDKNEFVFETMYGKIDKTVTITFTAQKE